MTGTSGSGREEEEAMWTARLLVLASLFAPAALGESIRRGGANTASVTPNI